MNAIIRNKYSGGRDFDGKEIWEKMKANVSEDNSENN